MCTRLPSQALRSEGSEQDTSPCLEHSRHLKIIHWTDSGPTSPTAAAPFIWSHIFSFKVLSGTKEGTLLSASRVSPTPWLQPSPSLKLFSGQKGTFASPPCNQPHKYFSSPLKPVSPQAQLLSPIQFQNPILPFFPLGEADRPRECQWVQGPACPDWLHPARTRPAPFFRATDFLPLAPNPHRSLRALLSGDPGLHAAARICLPGSGVQRDTDPGQVTFK